MENNKAVRNYKDTVFRLLFSNKEGAIELYNALEGENLSADTDIEFATLEDAIYVDRKNDLGFIVDRLCIVISEMQSTISYNIPIRDLGYISRTFERMLRENNIYSRRGLKLPAPKFYVLYTGCEKWKDEYLRLSNHYTEKPSKNSLELVVKVVNLGYTERNEMLKKSPRLAGYNKLLEYTEMYKSETGDLTEAIGRATKRCIKEGYIKDFLQKHSKEVASMLFEEITWEEFAEIRAKEAAEEAHKAGIAEGLTEGRSQGLAEGRKSGGLDIARKMIARKMPVQDIIDITGLTESEIKEIKSEK